MVSLVQHHAGLVDELMAEHRLILKAYGELRHAADAADEPRYRAALEGFKSLLVPHLIKEAVKVYTFLRKELKDKGDTAAFDRVSAYKSEMAPIGDAVLKFIDEELAQAKNAINFARAQATLEQMGKTLGSRVHREEADLYPLYRFI